MSDEIVIPVLPCASLGETLGFFRALGLEVTHEQEWPYAYGAVRWGGAELHFHGTGARTIPRASAASCLVMVPGVEAPHPEVTYTQIASGEAPPPEMSPLAQALDTAVWLRDLRGFDDAAAARVLDKALAKDEPAPPVDLARVLAGRAELALALGESARATELRAQLADVPLSADERERYQDELRAPEDLERLLQFSPGGARSTPGLPSAPGASG
jgi:hypothetical protein